MIANLPKHASHKAFACILTLALAMPFWAIAAKKTEQSKEALSDVQQRLEALKKELDNSQEAHKDAADALKESELAISEANKKLYNITQQQQQNKRTLSQLEAQSLSVNGTLAEQQKLLSNQLYEQYIHGQQNYVQMILQSENPSEIARDVFYFSYVAKARAELINKMQGNLDRISKLNNETAKALKEVAELKQRQMEERKVLENQKQAKSKVVKSLSQQIASQRVEIKKLARDEKRLSQLVERLAKIIPAKSKRKLAKNNPPDNQTEPAKKRNEVVANNDVVPTYEPNGASFATLKGKLRLPVRGEVTNRFGASREDSGISWKGLFIKANEGAEVKSVASGQVVFADWLRGFGNLIIVDHGEGYMSLYGNNQAVLKQVGDRVKTGDVLASVGNSGGNEANGLYYELRRQSRPFDPLSWSTLN